MNIFNLHKISKDTYKEWTDEKTLKLAKWECYAKLCHNNCESSSQILGMVENEMTTELEFISHVIEITWF